MYKIFCDAICQALRGLFTLSIHYTIFFLKGDDFSDVLFGFLHTCTPFSEDKTTLTLLLLNMTCPILANSVDPDQLASEEAN